jgi:hypothetical protein
MFVELSIAFSIEQIPKEIKGQIPEFCIQEILSKALEKEDEYEANFRRLIEEAQNPRVFR